MTLDEALSLVEAEKLLQHQALMPFQCQRKHLMTAFGGRNLARITAANIVAHCQTRIAAGAAPGTVNRELGLLGRVYTLARRLGNYRGPVPYIQKLREDNVRQGFFEESELERLVRELPEHQRDFARFGYETGWRVSEVRGLCWRHITDEGIRLDAGSTKNKDGRLFPWTAELTAIIARRRAVRSEGIPWVFHYDGRPLRWHYGAWRGACRRAGLEGRHYHDFRRTAVRRLERAGVPRSVAMRLTGHRTENVYQRYAVTAESDLQVAVALLHRVKQ